MWLRGMMRVGGVKKDALTHNFDERREFEDFLNGARAPGPPMAYKYSTRLAMCDVPYAAGITGLYAAGQISEALRLLASAITKIGPESALTILAALPAVVDTFTAPDRMDKQDKTIARTVMTKALKRYGDDLDRAWSARERGANPPTFRRGSDGVDKAFHRFFGVAQALEEDGRILATDIRDACLPGILYSGREAYAELTAPECLYHAYLAASTGREWPSLKRYDFDSCLEFGARLRISPTGERRIVEHIDSSPRRRPRSAKDKKQ